MKTEKKTKIVCVTISCCSLGFISIEIWRETTCHYVEIRDGEEKDVCNYTFDGEKEINDSIIIEQPVLLAGLYSSKGKNLVLPTGSYDVNKNQFEFIPKQAKGKEYCYIREVEGEFLGHSYHYKIELCIIISFDIDFGDKSVVEIATNLSEEEIKKVIVNNGEVTFNEDEIIQDEKVNFTLSKGNYIVNEDGKVYLQNIKVK